MQSGDQAKRERKRRKIDKLRGPAEGGVGFLAVRVVRAGRISTDRCPGNRPTLLEETENLNSGQRL